MRTPVTWDDDPDDPSWYEPPEPPEPEPPEPEPPPRPENRRRAKLFARAEKTLMTAARIAGSRAGVSAIYARNGRRAGLVVYLPGVEMWWTPRGGYQTAEEEELPF